MPYVGWGTAFFDFDNDGWQDPFFVNGHVYSQVDSLDIGIRYGQPKILLLNRRDGTFLDISKLVGPTIQMARASRGAAFGDLFNNGTVDIVVADVDGAPMILNNVGATRNHWISLEQAATNGNRLAIGARVKVVAGGLAQTDEVRSGGSYLSQSDLRLHFGLGSANKVERVEIRWPSGKIETLVDLAADRFYTVLEGEGVVPPERARPSAGKRGQPRDASQGSATRPGLL